MDEKATVGAGTACVLIPILTGEEKQLSKSAERGDLY